MPSFLIGPSLSCQWLKCGRLQGGEAWGSEEMENFLERLSVVGDVE